MAATERIPVMVTAKEKAYLFKKARAAKISVSEMLRQAGEAYEPEQGGDVLEELLAAITASGERAIAAVEDAERFCAESNARIAAMEAAHAARQRP